MPDQSPAPLLLDVVSDAICPWCWIGKRRLEAAARLLPAVPFALRWRPFLLNPGMPPEGVERAAYRAAKFGAARGAALDAEVRAVGASVGLEFRHERMRRTPNTLAAHRLIAFAGRAGRQDAVVEALFHAYFTAGRDIGDAAELGRLAAAAGLDDAAAAHIAGEAGQEALLDELDSIAEFGLRGVPSVLAGGRVLFTGAQPPEAMAAAIARAQASMVGAAGFEPTTPSPPD